MLALTALEARSDIGNLPPESRDNGFISVKNSTEEIYTEFYAATREACRDRFDAGVLFVAADNPRSLHTTTTKLGAESLGLFYVDGRCYHFLAYAF